VRSKFNSLESERIETGVVDLFPDPQEQATMDAEDLSMVSSCLGRLMLQGTVNGKCYRLIAELVDRKEWNLEPVTGYR